jgi:hypothetical protein
VASAAADLTQHNRADAARARAHLCSLAFARTLARSLAAPLRVRAPCEEPNHANSDAREGARRRTYFSNDTPRTRGAARRAAGGGGSGSGDGAEIRSRTSPPPHAPSPLSLPRSKRSRSLRWRGLRTPSLRWRGPRAQSLRARSLRAQHLRARRLRLGSQRVLLRLRLGSLRAGSLRWRGLWTRRCETMTAHTASPPRRPHSLAAAGGAPEAAPAPAPVAASRSRTRRALN